MHKDGDHVTLITSIHEEPDFSNKGQRFSIKTSLNQIIFVTAEATPRLHYGDNVRIEGLVQERKLPQGVSLLVFNYPEITFQKEPDNILIKAALHVRKQNKEIIEKTLPPTSASLLLGIVFGAKEHFTQEFKQRLSSTGVLHVIAASGMNVSFIAAALLFIFGGFVRRQMALIGCCLGIVFYVFLVGFEPSIIRAAIMAILAFGAGILGRQNMALFSILVTGYVMLLIKPSFLFDVGFQLSFMATLGILLSGGLNALFSGVRVGDGEWGINLKKLHTLGDFFKESLLTTFAAQVATLPILLGVFGSFGIVSLLVNGIVLWVVPIVMTIGGIAVLVGLLIPPLAQALLYLSLPFLLFFESVVSFFGGLGWNIQIESFPWPLTLGYYLFLGALLWELRGRKKII